ncbi:unnamed protein product, partial [Ilex paraguariensis]
TLSPETKTPNYTCCTCNEAEDNEAAHALEKWGFSMKRKGIILRDHFPQAVKRIVLKEQEANPHSTQEVTCTVH